MKKKATRYRAIFLSDIHLGTRGCKAQFLLDFLKHTESDHLYLVGDIVDGWRLKKHWYWPQLHNDVVQKLLRKARKGTRVVFIPGNHDEFARNYTETEFGGIAVDREAIHEAADGKRYLVIHGDEFDGVVKYAKWLAKVGDFAYVWLLEANHWFNVIRHRLGLPYWSLSRYLKHKVKNAVKYIDDFETSMAEVARMRDADGIVCGHIHHAEIREINGIRYCNDGDWVESCTALVEHFDGTMEILHWSDQRQLNLFDAYGAARSGKRKGAGSAAEAAALASAGIEDADDDDDDRDDDARVAADPVSRPVDAPSADGDREKKPADA